MPSKFILLASSTEIGSHIGNIVTPHNPSSCHESPLPRLCCTRKEKCDILKSSVPKMDQSFPYINKLVTNVTDNSRSQSLPDCLDIVKKPSVLNNCNHATSALTYVENVNTVENSETPNVLKSQDIWFKTWPERGDKSVVNAASDTSTHPEKSVKFTHGISRDCASCCHDSVNQTNPNFISNALCQLSNGSNDTSCSSNRNENYDRESNTPSTYCGISKYDPKNCENLESHITPASIPLNQILQSIPLAYSPVTRQLHIIGQEENLKKTYARVSAPTTSNFSSIQGIDRNKTDSSRNKSDAEISEINVEQNGSLNFDSPCNTLPRMAVCENCHTDASSFSSIVSSLSDVSPSVNDDNTVDEGTKTNRTADQESFSSSDISICEEAGPSKFRRRGIYGFFSRGVFSWRRDGGSQGCSHPAWRLWGSRNSTSVPASAAAASADETQGDPKQFVDVVASSSALILHRRPSNLPAKCPDEEQKHRNEYQRMVEAARKKELKEAKLRKKQLAQQLRQEEQLAQAARVWSSEILPKWDHMKNSRKAKDLWWQGLPPCVRGRVWQLAIGNDLNITPQLYDICVSRAQERLRVASEDLQQESQHDEVDGAESPDKESSVELIQLDISRTFPNLCIFQKGGPYYDILHSLLGAYVCYRPDVGYVQGMSFIAAVLILNLEPADAFICFANLLNQPCHMAFFRLDQPVMNAYYAAYDCIFRENLPRLHAHFLSANLTADLYLLDWLYTVFAKAMPLDVACRVWDVFLRDGEEFLFKTALGVLHLHQDTLLQLDFLHGAQFLTRLPDDMSADRLFRSIESIRMSAGKLRFTEVLASHMEPS